MSLYVSDEEWERWQAEGAERRAAAERRDAWKRELATVPGGWRGRGAEQEMARSLRGELTAQEVVARLSGEVNLLRWYATDLEALFVREARRLNRAHGFGDLPVSVPAGVALLRLWALGDTPLPDGEYVDDGTALVRLWRPMADAVEPARGRDFAGADGEAF